MGGRGRRVPRFHRPARARGMELSSYPEGTAEQPVVGVSWYKAAAYAAYAGKSLPTYWHWNMPPLRASTPTSCS